MANKHRIGPVWQPSILIFFFLFFLTVRSPGRCQWNFFLFFFFFSSFWCCGRRQSGLGYSPSRCVWSGRVRFGSQISRGTCHSVRLHSALDSEQNRSSITATSKFVADKKRQAMQSPVDTSGLRRYSATLGFSREQQAVLDFCDTWAANSSAIARSSETDSRHRKK